MPGRGGGPVFADGAEPKSAALAARSLPSLPRGGGCAGGVSAVFSKVHSRASWADALSEEQPSLLRGEAAGKPPQPQHHPCRPSSDAAPSLKHTYR